MIKSTIFLFWLVCSTSILLAQTTHPDSMAAIAKADAKKFMLDKDDLKLFRQMGPGRRNSDFFKPIAAGVSDSRLLLDSAYVKVYRQTAFLKTRKRHTAGHYILIYGSAIAGAVIIIAIVLVAVNGVGPIGGSQ